MSSKRCALRVSLIFLLPGEGGRRSPAITDRYQPRIKVDKYLSSCIIESISGKVETLEPGKAYKVFARLTTWEQMEDYIGKTVEALFPLGSLVEIFEVDEARPVARGVVLGVERE